MPTKRTYNLFPDGNNPIIIRIPVSDQYVNDDGICYGEKFPISNEQIDDEIIVSYDGKIMSLAEYKQNYIISSEYWFYRNRVICI